MSESKKWYDKPVHLSLSILLLPFFIPLFFYGLYKSSLVSAKIKWGIVGSMVFLLYLNRPDLTVPEEKKEPVSELEESEYVSEKDLGKEYDTPDNSKANEEALAKSIAEKKYKEAKEFLFAKKIDMIFLQKIIIKYGEPYMVENKKFGFMYFPKHGFSIRIRKKDNYIVSFVEGDNTGIQAN